MMDNGGLSVADALALGREGNNDGFGGGSGYWLFFLFFLLAWGGNWSNRGGNMGTDANAALTRGELCQDMNFQSLENAVRGINSGLCDGFYAMNTGMLNGFSGVQNTLCSGFAEIAAQGNNNTNAIQNSINAMNLSNVQNANAQNVVAMQNANAIQSQLAQCCCDNREGQAAIRTQLAETGCNITNTIQNTTRDIVDVNNANTKQILDFMINSRMQDLQSENQSLKLSASQQAQNNYLISQLRPSPIPAYTVSNPYCCGIGYNGAGYYNNGCGCNC